MPGLPDVTAAGVDARDLVLAHGPSVALASSTFRIPSGGVTAVIGPNGSGKSTLLNAIAGLVTPAEGHLEVLGRTPVDARRRIAYVLQSTKVNEVIPVTVAEVVAMGRYAGRGPFERFRREDREAVAAALERLDLVPLAGRHLRELSGGQRQRVFVAQGLAQDRDLLLLDEPLTGLDLPSGERIVAAIEEERSAGRTVVVTTHHLTEARLADHVLLLSGRLVAEGPPERVLTAEHLAAAYGIPALQLASEPLMDDPHHLPSGARHVHLDRSEHLRPPEHPGGPR